MNEIAGLRLKKIKRIIARKWLYTAEVDIVTSIYPVSAIRHRIPFMNRHIYAASLKMK